MSNRAYAAAIIGNALEWYDFTVYGYLTVTISRLFFAPAADWTPILQSLAVFAVAFFMRPLGGIILGNVADRMGRRLILILVVALMTVGTGMIAFAPTYAQIGPAAPVAMLAARLIQGLAIGGEFATSTAYLVESAPSRWRGFYSAWQFSGQGAAILLAGIVGTLVSASLTAEQLDAWGWRLPFLLGMLVGPAGLYMRASLAESAEFLGSRVASAGEPRLPIGEAVLGHKRRMLVGLGLVVGGTASIYVLLIFMPTYATRSLMLSTSASLVAPVTAGLVLMLACPALGYLSDVVGRRPVMAAAAAILALCLYPAFAWLQSAPSLARLAAIEAVFGLLVAAYIGPLGAALAELFPVGIRSTAMSVAYNIAVALFGGLAPFIVAGLIAATGDPFSPCYYVAVAQALSLLALFLLGRASAWQGHADSGPYRGR